jgi:16S rRNA processing protein RimM
MSFDHKCGFPAALFFIFLNKLQHMAEPELFRLGKILKPFGSKGEVVAYLDVDDLQQYRSLDMVFVGINKNIIPFFIDAIQLKTKNQAILKFQDIDSHADTEIIIGSELFLPAGFLPKLKGNKFYFHEVIGFEVIDKEKGNIGHISRVLELPYQSVIEIHFNGKEILIPIADELIKKVDRKNKVILVEAPDGLIDMYLQS